MSWTITPQQRFTPSALLDRFPGAAAAYSLRNLVGTSNPNVVRVRRSSDNAEQDFTAVQVTDGTLTAFCGAGNGFVRTWYDQSGNGTHVNQSTASNQPQLVISGSLNLLNSKPSLKFDGADDFLTGGDILDLGSNSLTSFAFSELGANGTIYGKSISSAGAGRYALVASAPATYSVLDILGNGNDATIAAAFAQGLFCQQIINGSTNKLFVNGVERASVSISSYSGLNTPYRFLIGAYSNSTDTNQNPALYLNGSMSELVLYLSDQSSNRPGIQASINAHYAIY